MKETYFVGYDPEIKLWDAQLLTPDFSNESWVFKVTARNGHDAMIKGLEQYQNLTQKLTGDEMRLAVYIQNQIGQSLRKPDDILMVDIPPRLMPSAEALAGRGFFTLAHREDALISLRSAGWKAINKHVLEQVTLDREYDEALTA
ncbi:hypothetical protein IFT48_04680 [Pseudomonas fluorescens]|uniref:hypothetical protein n=1 Tax=Pseudomonas fluorescens TaxID=294 RepID=UPI00177BEE8B|nr:hypothetical protein [Pseudomonas fluorescens]MBD8089269.1 hypothetical protein [Pseudomonas fluorescens]MBD8615304.1 hypothetical protein [Pseudomonas putida]